MEIGAFGRVFWRPLRAGFLLLIRRWGIPAVLPCLRCGARWAMEGRVGSCPAGSGAGTGPARSPATAPASTSAPAPSAAPFSWECCSRAWLGASVLPKLPLKNLPFSISNGSRASARRLGLHPGPCNGAGTSQRGCCHRGGVLSALNKQKATLGFHLCLQRKPKPSGLDLKLLRAPVMELQTRGRDGAGSLPRGMSESASQGNLRPFPTFAV